MFEGCSLTLESTRRSGNVSILRSLLGQVALNIKGWQAEGRPTSLHFPYGCFFECIFGNFMKFCKSVYGLFVFFGSSSFFIPFVGLTLNLTVILVFVFSPPSFSLCVRGGCVWSRFPWMMVSKVQFEAVAAERQIQGSCGQASFSSPWASMYLAPSCS